MPGLIILLTVIGGAALYEYLKNKSPQPPIGGANNQSKFGSGPGAIPPVITKGTGATAPYTEFNPFAVPSSIPLDIQSQFGSRYDAPPGPPPDAPVAGTDVIIEDGIARMANAIARAEGYGTPGAIPTVTNNPGDLKLGDHGYGTVNGKTKFGSTAEGWAHLRAQIRLGWLDRSDYYGPDDTFQQIAETWTGGDNSEAWLATVSSALGVSSGTTLRGYLTGGTARI